MQLIIVILALPVLLLAYTPPSAAVSALNSYRGYGDLTSAAGSMDIDQYTRNLITWQMPHGGFFKAYADKYVNPWNGSAARSDQVRDGVELGTIDNNATIQEMRLLAVRYKASTNSSDKTLFKNAFQKALGFIVTSQQAKGGWPQMYPARGNYSDMATYNDNAMVRVMVLAKDIAERVSPFDSDIASDTQRAQMQNALNKSIDFALKAQIVNNGQPTVWCAQHDPNTYAPVEARSYELASKSGSESAGVVWMLMNWPDQTATVQAAVKGALTWYKRTRVADLKFSDGNFVAAPGASLWYRFYEVANDQYFFCDRAGVSTKTQDITKLSDDRRYGYQWAGDYGSKLLAAEAGYLAALATNPSSSSSVVSSSSSSLTTPQCGGSSCTTVLQAENYCRIDGVTESTNDGFSGLGYANVNNAQNTSVGYALQMASANTITLFIRYANGAATARNAKIVVNGQMVVADLSLPPTGTWTTWSTVQTNLALAAGRDSLVLQSLTADGMPNIDWLGWLGANPTIASCEAPTTIHQGAHVQIRIRNGNLNLDNLPKDVSLVRIRNFAGKEVYSQRITHASNDFIMPLPKGAYVIEIESTHSPKISQRLNH